MKIAIAGYGVEGRSNYAYWSKLPDADITIVDEKLDISTDVARAAAGLPDAAKVLTGEGVFSQLDDFDMVVRTAGLAPSKITTNGKIWSATNEFFEKCPAPIIGVTGSKGKGTTASLIASILEASVEGGIGPAARKIWLVGNIGVPSLDVLAQISADDIVVYELSSFQLWDLQRSPHIAVVLLIEQEHLDVHEDMEDYVRAKAQITRWQTAHDYLIFNSENSYATAIADSSKAVKVAYPSPEAAHIHDDAFYYGDTYVSPIDALRIPGEHNKHNALAAIDAVWPYVQDTTVITAGLSAFYGLPHRLAFVATVSGVEYYDDSIATTPSSAIAALRAFTHKPKVIILGGSYKGSDFTELAQELTKHEVTALLIGDEAERIAEACDTAGFDDYAKINGADGREVMRNAVRHAAEIAEPGAVVLLSPSAASFGLFKNYADRGEWFIAEVHEL